MKDEELQALRAEMDRADSEILDLYLKRMAIVEKLADWKRRNHESLPLRERERQTLVRIWEKAGSKFGPSAKALFSTIFELARTVDAETEVADCPVAKNIEQALAEEPGEFPKHAKVACSGIPGAYAQIAADRIFSLANIMYFNNFAGVFQAVERGLCDYGVLPIENSTTGTVDAVCDLMKNYNFHIVRSTRLHVTHTLLAKRGATLEGLKEVVSHEQGLKQCANFLNARPNLRLSVCPSTALAAKTVSESPRTDIAAIASPECAEIYDLQPLAKRIQNSDFNYTRFICISKKMKIFPGANRISVMTSLPHRSGSLYHLLARFAALDLNLTKLESRPVPGSEFEYTFYFDFEASVRTPEVRRLLSDLAAASKDFVFLGNYAEF